MSQPKINVCFPDDVKKPCYFPEDKKLFKQFVSKAEKVKKAKSRVLRILAEMWVEGKVELDR